MNDISPQPAPTPSGAALPIPHGKDTYAGTGPVADIFSSVSRGLPEAMTAQVFTSPMIDKIAGALAKAQGAVKPIVKEEEGKVKGTSKASGKDYEYSYKYAGLDAILDGIREAFSGNGLTILFRLPPGKGAVHTLLIHESGQWIDYGLYALGAANTHQERGGSITYARRYMTLAIGGVAGADEADEGEKANETLGREHKTPPRRAAQQPTAADDFGPPVELPDDSQIRNSAAPKTDKENRADYQAAKDKYKIPQSVTKDGYIDFDAVAAGLEDLIPKAKSMNEISMIKKANSNSLENMEIDRPDLYKFISELFQTTSSKLA